MKIALIAAGFSKKGGISRYTAELAERFVKKYEVHLITSDYNYCIPNLTVHIRPMISKPFWLRILTNAYFATKYSKKIKEKFKIDVIHSNDDCLLCDIVTMHACYKAWIKHYKSLGWLQHIRGLIDLSDLVALPIEKRILEKGSKKIIAVSEGVKREILENYNVPEEKITVIPNGVDLEEFKPNQGKREEIRKQYTIDDDEIVLIFAGHEFSRKGLRYIIAALPKIQKPVKLFVVGKDNPKQYKALASKLKVSNKVIFTGFVPEINHYYAASDIFVFPTVYEAFSLATLEAVASGLPILATKVNGTEELIEDGYNGFFVERKPEDIAEKINILIEDENLRKQMSKNARKSAEKYSWDEIARRTMEVYDSVAK